MDSLEVVLKDLQENDARTLESRAARKSEVSPFTYEGVNSPVYEYLRELDKLYVDGHFMATIVFAAAIVEYVLRQRLYLVADILRVDRAGLGTLCTMAARKKVLSNNAIQQVRLVNKMRNTVVHVDTDFAQDLMEAAIPDIDDPYVRTTWFFGGSRLSLMANICAEMARNVAGSPGNY